MAATRLARALALLSVASTVSSLYVVPGSDCAAMCLGGANSTSSNSIDPSISAEDVVCHDDEYSSDGTGIRYRACIECLKDSEATDGEDSDLQYMLYNMRYVLNTCLFEDETAVQSPCIINYGCEPLESAITTGLTTPGEQHFDYCTANNSAFADRPHWWCVQCLQSSESQIYLSNFLQVLKAGCEQDPELGDTLYMSGQIFSEDLLNVTVSNTTLPGEGGASATDLTTGAIVGIGVGGGLFAVGAAVLIFVFCRRRNKRKAEEAEGHGLDDSPGGHRSNTSSFTAINKSPYLAVGDQKRPLSTHSSDHNAREKQGFASNADYYDQLTEHAQAGRYNPSYNFDPRAHQHGPGSAMPTHAAYNPRIVSKEPSGPSAAPVRRTNVPESYALQAFLNATDDPAVHASHSGSAPRSRSATPSGRGTPAGSRASSERPAASTMMTVPPPPPGPPPSQSKDKKDRSSKAPSLSLPSLPRVRVPKKYAPPTIVVDDATPDGKERRSDSAYISGPLSHHQHEQRFTDKPLGGHAVVSTEPRPANDYSPESDYPPNTGKSSKLYG